MAVAGVLLLAGAAATVNLGWGWLAATSAIVVFLAGGFWANYVLFGDVRPFHTGANVMVGALILWLLWIGYSVPES